jgi:hypothetical protein
MCPFEEWLGFCPFAALSRLRRFITGRSADAGWVPVKWKLLE